MGLKNWLLGNPPPQVEPEKPVELEDSEDDGIYAEVFGNDVDGYQYKLFGPGELSIGSLPGYGGRTVDEATKAAKMAIAIKRARVETKQRVVVK